jgi:hypothetical protein
MILGKIEALLHALLELIGILEPEHQVQVATKLEEAAKKIQDANKAADSVVKVVDAVEAVQEEVK